MTYKDELSKIPSGITPAPYQRMFTPDKMLSLIQDNPNRNVGAYARLIGCSRSTALNLLNSLIKEGKIKKTTVEIGAAHKPFATYSAVKA